MKIIHGGAKAKAPIYSTQDIYYNLIRLFQLVAIPARVKHINIAVSDLAPATPIQLGFFNRTRLDSRLLAYASDKINDHYGEFTVVPALMANMKNIIIKRVPFGSVRDI